MEIDAALECCVKISCLPLYFSIWSAYLGSEKSKQSGVNFCSVGMNELTQS